MMLSARDRRLRLVRPKRTRGVVPEKSRSLNVKKYRGGKTTSQTDQHEDVFDQMTGDFKLGKEKKTKSLKTSTHSKIKEDVREKQKPNLDVADGQGDDDDENIFDEDAAISVSEGEDDDWEDEEMGHHDKMLEAITFLDRKKRTKQARRSEPAQEVSELNLQPSEGDKIQLGDLLGSLRQTAVHGELKKKLLRMQKKPLEAPLSKPQAERVQRTVAYREAAQELSKWQPIVRRNRQAEHLSFPLKQHSFTPPPLSTSSIQLRPVTTLEKEIMALMNGPGTQHDISNKKIPHSESEEKALKAMDHEKALERRHELQKIRTLQSFYEQKARRQNKIKSKKYRRLKKKAKERNLEKMSVDLDPEVAKLEFEKAEAVRAKERMTLRHHNKSKWARNILQRGHKDPASRQALTEQHQIGRELIQKTRPHKEDGMNGSSSEDIYSESSPSEDESQPIGKQETQDQTNPWLTGQSLAKVQTGKTKRRKRKKETMDNFKARKIPAYRDEEDVLLLDDGKKREENDAISDEDEEESIKEETSNNECDPDEESYFNDPRSLGDETDQQEEERQVNTESIMHETVDQDQPHTPYVSNCDPLKIISAIEGVDQNVERGGVRGLHSQQRHIAEAFANDDVVVEFMKEKEQEVEESTVKDIDLTLPGWGSWGGHGTKPRQKPQKQIVKKAPPAEPRQDEKLPHVIIRQMRDKKFAKHQVSQLPFPYTSRDQFEKVLCAPVGRHWNTEATFQGMIKPRVQTQMGAMIQPIEMTDEMKDMAKKSRIQQAENRSKKWKRKAKTTA